MAFGLDEGQLERVVHQACYDHVYGILDAHGWLTDGSWWRAFQLRGKPWPKGTSPIPFNSIVVLLGHRSHTGHELGSNYAELTWDLYIDMWTESRDVGMAVRGCLAGALAGRDSAHGYGTPLIPVYNMYEATPDLICHLEVDDVDGTNDVTPQVPWQENWYGIAGSVSVGVDDD